MSRISDAFAGLKQRGQTGFVAYITAGDPDLETTRALVLELERCGVDILELGVPFSDPLADGPEIQRAYQRALRHGISLADVLDLVSDLRKETRIPIVLFTYYNPVHRYGLERLVDRAAEVDIDGILALDLPPEEAGDYKRLMDARGLDTIFLIAPTSRDDRIRLISSCTTGFVYYISRTGVTGERERLADTVRPMVEKIRSHTFKPVAVGFGVSSPEHTAEIAGYADAVVVGSAIVRRIGEKEGDTDLVSHVGDFVKNLVRPLKEERHGNR
jgi:tryptophan synthase alpha chain